MLAKVDTVTQTNLPLPLIARGKVRDIYAVSEDKLLIVTSDRLSAYDVIFSDPIPYKGIVLTQISAFWFEFFKNEVSHHLITTNLSEMGLGEGLLSKFGSQLEGRTMLVKKCAPLPIECVIRGYVTGSGWKDYLRTGSVCGHQLPENLKECAKLEEPLFTPATKAEEGAHDENIDFARAAELAGEDVAQKAKELALKVYSKGRDFAAEKGIIIADTKFEFGLLNGELLLIDEVLTPDSSRFWPEDQYEEGRDQPSFDKQIVRNYVSELGWDKTPPAPKLPNEIIEKTSKAYLEIYERITGKKIL